MKNLITIAFLAICTIASSQNYLSIDSEWTEHAYSNISAPPHSISHSYTIRLEADTIINNKVYYKTKRDGTTTVTNYITNTVVSTTPINDYLKPLREDQGKFYIYNSFLNQEELLHDFTLSVGDTATTSCPAYPPQIVRKIELISFGTQTIKKFMFDTVSSALSTPLYEGIGTNKGLFVKPCDNHIGIEYGSDLHCYSTGDETIQIDTATYSCQTTSPEVSTIELITEIETIYPNPFTDQIIIENTWSDVEEITIELFDFQGHLVKSTVISTLNNQIELSTTEINSGAYILIINNRGRLYTKKLVKI